MFMRHVHRFAHVALALAPARRPGPAGRKLKLKLPSRCHRTPTNLRSPNLEPVTGKSRPPSTCQRAHAGVREEEGASSDSAPSSAELDMSNDGEKSGGG